MNKPAGGYRILPTSAPSSTYRPDITWVSDDLAGTKVNVSFAQRQAARRIQDLKSLDEPLPASTMAIAKPPHPPGHNKQKRQHGASGRTREGDAKRMMQGKAMAQARHAEDVKRTEILAMRRKEIETAAAERRQSEREREGRETEYKAKAKQEMEVRKNESNSVESHWKRSRETHDIETAEERKEPKRMAPPVYSVESQIDPQVIAPQPKLENVEAEIEAIRAAREPVTISHDVEASPSSSKPFKPEPSVDALVTERIQVLKKRVGDYSRYLPKTLGIRHTPRRVGPAAYAQLILARRPETGLAKRREAIQIIERFMKMSETGPEV